MGVRSVAAACAILLCVAVAQAGEARVAVSANFAAPMKELAGLFERASGHSLQLAFGATGKFYAQIRHGAPFDVLLAADADTPARLLREGAGQAGSQFTYAIGRLALWSPQPGRIDDRGEILGSNRIRHIAIANPRLAPYGQAAIETLKAVNRHEALQARFVQAENIAQAYQFIASGNAELGFVALSQVMDDGRLTRGSAWIVPQELYRPIRQDAVLLARGASNPAARALMDFLRSEQARKTIRNYGYDVP